jgi:hypothetical protein
MVSIEKRARVERRHWRYFENFASALYSRNHHSHFGSQPTECQALLSSVTTRLPGNRHHIQLPSAALLHRATASTVPPIFRTVPNEFGLFKPCSQGSLRVGSVCIHRYRDGCAVGGSITPVTPDKMPTFVSGVKDNRGFSGMLSVSLLRWRWSRLG